VRVFFGGCNTDGRARRGATAYADVGPALVSAGTLLTGDLASSVKALFVDSTGKQTGLTSEDIYTAAGHLCARTQLPDAARYWSSRFGGIRLA
jgi:hypothetical protein